MKQTNDLVLTKQKQHDGLDQFIVTTGTMKRKRVRALNERDAACFAIRKWMPKHIGYLIEIEGKNGTVYWDSCEALRVAGIQVEHITNT